MLETFVHVRSLNPAALIADIVLHAKATAPAEPSPRPEQQSHDVPYEVTLAPVPVRNVYLEAGDDRGLAVRRRPNATLMPSKRKAPSPQQPREARMRGRPSAAPQPRGRQA